MIGDVRFANGYVYVCMGVNPLYSDWKRIPGMNYPGQVRNLLEDHTK